MSKFNKYIGSIVACVLLLCGQGLAEEDEDTKVSKLEGRAAQFQPCLPQGKKPRRLKKRVENLENCVQEIGGWLTDVLYAGETEVSSNGRIGHTNEFDLGFPGEREQFSSVIRICGYARSGRPSATLTLLSDHTGAKKVLWANQDLAETPEESPKCEEIYAAVHARYELILNSGVDRDTTTAKVTLEYRRAYRE